MTRKKLESYQANKRMVERNRKKIEEEQMKNIPVVSGKVKRSLPAFPYTETHMTVHMDEPVEADRTIRRIVKWKKEIEQAEKETDEVERFIAAITDAKVREILTYRYIDGMRVGEIAGKTGYTHGRISQLISKKIKD